MVNSEHRHVDDVSRAALLIASLFLLSKLLGFIRQATINSAFGVSAEADAWFAAFRIPDTIFTLFAGGALVSALLPIYTELKLSDKRMDIDRLMSGCFNMLGIVLLALGILGYLFAEPLTYVLVPGFDAQIQVLTVDATRVLMICPIMLGFSALAKAVLHAERRFLIPAIGPCLYNIGIIFGAVVLSGFGIVGLAWGAVIGAVAHAVITLPSLRSIGLRYRPTVFTEYVGKALQLMAPRLIGYGAIQISFIVLNLLASLLGESSVSALNNAWLLLLLPLGVLAMPIGEANLPALADLYNAGKFDALQDQFRWACKNVLFMSLPITAVLIVLSLPVVTVLFERGAFDATASLSTATVLLCFLIGLPGHAAVEVLIRTFFAMQNTKTPVIVGVVCIGLHIGLSWVLSIWIGAPGLALGVSIGVLFEAIILWVLLSRLFVKEKATIEFFRPLQRAIIASICLGITAMTLLRISWVEGPSSWGSAIWLVGGALLLTIVFAVILVLLRAPEIYTVIRIFRSRIERLA